MISIPVPRESIDDLTKGAAARRSELAESYLSGAAVEALLGIDATALTRMRKSKQLLGVWHEPANAWLYPDFQFDRNGLIKQMPLILAVYDRFNSRVWEKTWVIVEWFMTPHVLLKDCSPRDAMATNPQRVFRVAQLEFWQDPATLW